MIAAPVVSVPVTLRPSFIVNALAHIEFAQRWHSMLTQLAPEKARRVSPLNVKVCYLTLVQHCSELFPIFEPFIDEDAAPSDWWEYGIPIEAQGYSHNYGHSPACAFINLTLNQYSPDLDDLRFTCLDEHARWLATWWPGKIPLDTPPPVRLPRGRVFKSTWAALPHLIAYATSNTDTGWLDYTSEDETANPPWDLDEIKALAAMWKKADEYYRPVAKLMTMLDSSPREFLPILDRALRGDADTLYAISEPKRPDTRARTLAEIFTA